MALDDELGDELWHVGRLILAPLAATAVAGALHKNGHACGHGCIDEPAPLHLALCDFGRAAVFVYLDAEDGLDWV